MRIGLCVIGQDGVTWERWCSLADACEQHGIETLFSSDHYLSRADEMRVAQDAWTTIAGLAARTTRLRFGTLVTPVTFRAPAQLAKVVATIDHISGGRVELGLGAGWMEREHAAFGFPFPDIGVRLEMFAEQLEIVHRLWTQERTDFAGRHYTLENAPGQPKPIQRPRPSILVGGSGKRATAEPAARFADEYNTAWVSPAEAAEVRQRVLRTCEAVGRDPETMRFSVVVHCIVGATRDEAVERAHELYQSQPQQEAFPDWLANYSQQRIVDSIDATAARLSEYKQVGCDRLMIIHPMAWDLESVQLIGQELIPKLNEPS